MIALSYYDGPTEGFLNGLNDDSPYFFKLIAWDASQDKRLFLMNKIDGAVFKELVDLLKNTQAAPKGPTWIPTWTFSDLAVASHANNLVEICRSALHGTSFFALAENLPDGIDVLHAPANVLNDAIAQAQKEAPGFLDDWLPRIG